MADQKSVRKVCYCNNSKDEICQCNNLTSEDAINKYSKEYFQKFLQTLREKYS